MGLIKTLTATGRNLLAGIRAALFLSLPLSRLSISWPQWLTLVALYLLMLFLRDFVPSDSAGEWSASGLIGALFPLSLLLVASIVLSAISGHSWRTLPVLIATTSLLLVLDTLGIFFPELLAALTNLLQITQVPWAVYFVPTAWLVLAASVVTIRLLDLRWRYVSATVLTYAILLGLPLATLWYDRTLWLAEPDDSAAEAELSTSPQLIAEEAFYKQPELLQQQLERVQAQRPGVTDLYWLGVAGYASQDVFMKEVLSVEQLFHERFDTAGRSLRLISNSSSLNSEPVASLTSLKQALQKIATAMDKNEDVLFLFLTSHGSAEQGFAFEFWPFELNNLQPKDLRAALDDTGIKHRVLVISACFSGIFIEPLRDDNTLIMTAAASDRNSFGCSNEADFTYFGKAFFDEALRTTHSFTAAFEQAKKRIAEREEQEGYNSSNPQLSVGQHIEQKLQELEQQLQAKANTEQPNELATTALTGTH